MRSRHFRVGLGLLVGAVFLYLSTRNVSWAEVRDNLRGAALPWIAAALLCYWTELLVRILRWRVLLAHVQPPIPPRFIGLAFVSGYAANNLLPAKLGELFRADLLGRLTNSSRLTVLGSIIIERLFDMVVVLGMAAWGVWTISTTALDTLDDVNRGLGVLVLPIVALLGGLYVVVRRRDSALLLRLKAVSDKVGNLIHGLRALEDPTSYLKLLALNILIWMLNCLAIWAIMASLGIQLSPNQTVLLIGVTGISAAIPAAPAGIGTLQYAFHITSLLLGFSAASAIAASALVQVALLGSATVIGALGYSYAVSTHLLGDRRPAQ